MNTDKASDWDVKDGMISKTYVFSDFPTAMKFVNDVATIAEKHKHHPDIDIRFNTVTLTLTTHDASGLTDKDYLVAGEIGALI